MLYQLLALGSAYPCPRAQGRLDELAFYRYKLIDAQLFSHFDGQAASLDTVLFPFVSSFAAPKVGGGSGAPSTGQISTQDVQPEPKLTQVFSSSTGLGESWSDVSWGKQDNDDSSGD